MKREEFNKFYVLTGDLDHVVGQWCQQNHLKPPSRKGFEKLRQSFHKDLENVVRKTAEHSGSDLEVQFTNRKQFSWLTKEKNDKGFWIALDDVYIPIADFNIGMTRIYDKHGECQLGHGFRPETDADSIENQIKNCRTKYVNAGSPKRVVLADDGTFTGSTIADMLGRLRDVEIKVTEVCMAFATFEGKAKIEKVIEKESRRILYHVGTDAKKDSILDWVCERDFFVGVPRSGRTTGARGIDGVPVPFAKPIIAFPYVKPWGPMSEGANISFGQKEFSSRLTSYSIQLWEAIQKVNGITLTVAQLPRFPGPAEPTEEILEMPLVEYLQTIEKWIFGDEPSYRRKKERIFI